MTARPLILGRDGQVGRALIAAFGAQALAAGRKEVDLSYDDFIPQMEQFVDAETVSIVINAAAYTKVDQAETGGREEAFRINGTAVAELAQWCKNAKVPLMHFSTDYVFDGSGDTPRRETDTPHPVNIYGQSKLAGERAIAAEGGQYLIVRTSWVYDVQGNNFANTIRRLLREKEILRVVSDQIGAPTYAPHLAQAVLALLPHLNTANGIYNLCNGGQTSWYDFAKAIFVQETYRDAPLVCQRIIPIPTAEYPLPAPRPLNSRLDCSKAKQDFGIALPSWEKGLDAYFEVQKSI